MNILPVLKLNSKSERLTALLERIEKEFPALQIHRKSDAWFFRILGKRFCNTVSITLGWRHIYLADEFCGENLDTHAIVDVLRHELIHVRQAMRLTTPVFVAAYVFLAYCRARFELEAYSESLRSIHELYPAYAKSREIREWVVSQFTSPLYLWMWPFRKQVTRWVQKVQDSLS